ncbi:4'-phosphopantetheinyl transferase family protein [Primorskyibacter sp. 2E233]|uniref:4'-phosphopantetheinyl transferase family protein n=1 Tax=Primorskyibacter sp. 2E233 TaxID=3413431 RepID=UPI003BF0AEAE
MTLGALCELMAQVALPPGLFWSAGQAEVDPAALFPDEAQAIARAIPKRQADFTGGRKAARAALAEMSLDPVPIPVAPTRAPVFPDGVVGSISHDCGLCIALVGYSDLWQSVGIDIAPDLPLEADLIAEICRPEERTGVDPKNLPRHARRLFSVKEAVYKAQFMQTGVIFGFQGLCVSYPKNVARFATIAETDPIPPQIKSRPLPFVQRCDHGLTLSISAIPA